MSAHQETARRNNNWETSTLGDTCEMYQPKTISGKDMVENGAYPVFGANGVIGRYSKFNHEEPQLLITCRGATCGSVNISEPKSWVTGNAMVVRSKDGLIEMRFLEYLFRGGIEISKAITGAAQPQITRTNLEPLEICYPRSLDEQHRIVSILDEAFARLATAQANAEKNLKNARALFESYLQSVFTQRGEGWVDTTLGNVCELFQGLCINAKTKHLLVESGDLPLLRIKDLRTNTAEQFVSKSGWPKNARVVESEIIYTRTGQIGLVFRGRSGVLHNNCFKVKPSPILNNDYLFWWLQNPRFRTRITALACKAAQPDITHTLFKAQSIELPPLEYQDAAIGRIHQMREETQRLETIYQQKLAALSALKKSLLHQAFSGQI